MSSPPKFRIKIDSQMIKEVYKRKLASLMGILFILDHYFVNVSVYWALK